MASRTRCGARTQQRNADADWDRWPVADYLAENYRELHPCDAAIVDHHSAFYRRFAPNSFSRYLDDLRALVLHPDRPGGRVQFVKEQHVHRRGSHCDGDAAVISDGGVRGIRNLRLNRTAFSCRLGAGCYRPHRLPMGGGGADGDIAAGAVGDGGDSANPPGAGGGAPDGEVGAAGAGVVRG